MSKSEKNPWYKKAFKDDYLWLYAHRSEAQASKEVSVAVKHVPFKAGQNVLDLACGAGRHMVAFASHAARLTGVDLSKPLLDRARDRLRELKIKARLVKRDMREIEYDGEFDGVTMWFTSFGYFDSISDDLKVLKNIRRALKTGGWWWIDLPNPSNLKASIVPRSQRTAEGPNGRATVIEERTIKGGRVTKRTTIMDRAGTREYIERVRLYGPEQFGSLVKQAGLVTLGILGNYDGATLTPNVPRQIWYGLRP